MGVSQRSASGLILSTSLQKAVSETIYPQLLFCVSVDAEGGVALLALAGEISYQLTIADHQKQAAT